MHNNTSSSVTRCADTAMSRGGNARCQSRLPFGSTTKRRASSPCTWTKVDEEVVLAPRHVHHTRIRDAQSVKGRPRTTSDSTTRSQALSKARSRFWLSGPPPPNSTFSDTSRSTTTRRARRSLVSRPWTTRPTSSSRRTPSRILGASIAWSQRPFRDGLARREPCPAGT